MRSFWSKLINRLAIVWLLTRRGDPLLTLQIIIFATAVPALMRLSLPRLQSLLAHADVDTVADPARVQKVISQVELVLQLGGPLSRRKCLSRGLTLFYFLRREGLGVALCFGMGRVAGEFAGHCWLMKDGQPFLEGKDPLSVFTELYSIPRNDHLSMGLRAADQE